jgi:UrcA family protein
MNRTIVLASLAAIPLAQAAVTADHVELVRTQVVHFADIDTSSTEGAAVLYRRIRHAAESVCRDLERPRQLELSAAYNNCLENAMSDAILTIDRPAVTAYAEKRGIPLTKKVRLASVAKAEDERL